MEQKFITVPFDLAKAKAIQNGELEGNIVDTYYHCKARIVDFNFITVKGKFIIIVSERNGNNEVYAICNEKGIIYLEKEGKFEDEPCFEIEIPEYFTFKDGDVLINRTKGYIFMLDKNGTYKTSMYVGMLENGSEIDFGGAANANNIENYTLAVEVEKQMLIKALQECDDPQAKNCLKKLGVEVKPKCELKPFDKVLARDSEEYGWEIDFFSQIIDSERKYMCLTNNWKYCIPYEGNEYLLGTNKNEEE